MEENYSDTEHISKKFFYIKDQTLLLVVGKRKEKFYKRVIVLRTFIFVLLAFGLGLTLFATITWKSSSNEILKSLAITGIITVFASSIGLFGCNRCLKHLEVIRTTKMKESPGQEALLIFFYFNFLLFCCFLLFGTWCFFYQDDATAWLEAKYTDKESWEKDFKGIQLATVQNNIQLILTIAGILSLIVAVITFACIYYSLKISMVFETIHTIVQVQNFVSVIIALFIIYSGAIAKNYYSVPQVSESEPDFLPQVLIGTGVAMIMVAFLGFFASKAESKSGLMSYSVFCVILLVNFLIFTVLLNYGSQTLQTTFEEKCNEVMPFFNKNFFYSFGCMNKYTQNSTDVSSLTCDKEEIATIWENNVGLDVEEQSAFYGCLNEKCCIAMISFVKGKFNFLAAFCIVAFFFIMVAIMTSQYMYKKIKKYHTRILSHKNDNALFALLVIFTIGLCALFFSTIPAAPSGLPQPDKESQQIAADYLTLYDLSVDKSVGVGSMNLLGWITFEKVSLFQSEGSSDSAVVCEVSIKSYPANGEFRINGDHNTTVTNNTEGYIKLSGKISEINETMSELEFKPGCILDHSNALELNLTFFKTRILDTNETSNDSDTIQFGVPRRYHINLNMNSGQNRTYRAKLVDENTNATGPANYFKELTSGSDINMTVTLPFFKHCPAKTITVGSYGLVEYNMTLLNHSIPYTMRIRAERKTQNPIVFDYFVGGYPETERVEMGTYSFYTADSSSKHNVTGRLFDAFTNKTFFNDYTITVYQGYGELNKTNLIPFESIDYYGNGEYYTGFFELYDLHSNAYVAVVESFGYINNFQRFYALPSPPYTKQMRAIPLVPDLKEGELALVLNWGYSPRDLDIHVEFIASPTILCQCDYSMHQCGGVKYMTDTQSGGDRGADVIKFDYIGDFQYIVYVSLFKHKSSPKVSNTTQTDVTLQESQAQLKVFAPYYSWPVFNFDVPAAASTTAYQYWTVFCFNGRDGLKNLVPINQLSAAAPDVSTCENFYGTRNIFFKTQFLFIASVLANTQSTNVEVTENTTP